MNQIDPVVSVYSDARAEYTKQLCIFVVPAYFQFFINLLEKAKETMAHEPKRILWQFQTYLNEIPDWNMEKVNHEIAIILTNSGCDYFEDLLTAVFIAHTKVLTAIRISSKQKNVQITVPKVDHFLFKVLCECAKLLWSSTYLFRDGVSAIEKQQNYKSIEILIGEGVQQAIRSLVPVKSILKDFMSVEDEEEAEKEANEDMMNDDQHDRANELNKNEGEHIPQLDETKENNNDVKTIQTTVGINSNIVNTIHTDENNIQMSETNQNTDSEVKNESDSDVKTTETPIIDLDNHEQRNVLFSEFDTVFDSDNPNNSDMIYESRDDSDENPGIEILEENGITLDNDDTIESLDEKKNEESVAELIENEVEPIDGYEEL
jgi:hypothetical protein